MNNFKKNVEIVAEALKKAFRENDQLADKLIALLFAVVVSFAVLINGEPAPWYLACWNFILNMAGLYVIIRLVVTFLNFICIILLTGKNGIRKSLRDLKQAHILVWKDFFTWKKRLWPAFLAIILTAGLFIWLAWAGTLKILPGEWWKVLCAGLIITGLIYLFFRWIHFSSLVVNELTGLEKEAEE